MSEVKKPNSWHVSKKNLYDLEINQQSRIGLPEDVQELFPETFKYFNKFLGFDQSYKDRFNLDPDQTEKGGDIGYTNRIKIKEYFHFRPSLEDLIKQNLVPVYSDVSEFIRLLKMLHGRGIDLANVIAAELNKKYRYQKKMIVDPEKSVLRLLSYFRNKDIIADEHFDISGVTTALWGNTNGLKLRGVSFDPTPGTAVVFFGKGASKFNELFTAVSHRVEEDPKSKEDYRQSAVFFTNFYPPT